MRKRAIICDIDQCLLDSLVPVEMKNRAMKLGTLTESEAWNRFYDNLRLCKRNEWCFELIEKLTRDNDIKVIFITGREERARRDTEAFFKFKTPVDWKMYMRPNGCLEEDAKVKYSILAEIKKDYDFLFALDDREANCETYRDFGVTTLKVTSLELH